MACRTATPSRPRWTSAGSAEAPTAPTFRYAERAAHRVGRAGGGFHPLGAVPTLQVPCAHDPTPHRPDRPRQAGTASPARRKF
jgi:hypothetical protein